MKNKSLKILVAEKSSFSERGLAALSQIAPTFFTDISQQELTQAIKAYNILVIRLGLYIDRTVLSANPKLLLIATPTTGLDHIDISTADQLGIKVISLQGEQEFLEQVYATAEHTMALLLCLIRRIPSAFDSIKNYQWRRDIHRGHELNGKILGIVGYGRLGKMVARYCRVFGMKVIVYDPYLKKAPKNYSTVSSLEELLTKSDVVSIHVPLNDQTIGMFSFKQFEQMKPGTWLINTARGSVIDESAILQSLNSRHLAGAALDVLDDELFIKEGTTNPLIDYARTHDNLIITPHIGGATYESIEKADLFLAHKIKKYLTSITQN